MQKPNKKEFKNVLWKKKKLTLSRHTFIVKKCTQKKLMQKNAKYCCKKVCNLK